MGASWPIRSNDPRAAAMRAITAITVHQLGGLCEGFAG